MNKEQVELVLQECGALLSGHFLLTSGRHSDKYMQGARILRHPKHAQKLVAILAEAFADERVDIVLSPAVGGILLGYELARTLGCENIFAEREGGVMTLRRGFNIPRGARVLLAEDVLTTGGTVFEVIELAKSYEAELCGVASLVDRSNGKIDFGIKSVSAYTTDINSWVADDCELCKQGIPLTKPGSRTK